MAYLVNLCPIVLNLLLLPFWYIDRNGMTSFCELILNGIFVPVFLLIFNIVRMNQHKEYRLGLLLTMFVSVIGSAFIHYLNWGIVTGCFFHPDVLTVGFVLWIEVLFPLAILCVGMVIYGVVGVFRSRKRNHQDNQKKLYY